VTQLAELLKAPVAYAYRGKHWLEWGETRTPSDEWMLGYAAADDAMHRCDG